MIIGRKVQKNWSRITIHPRWIENSIIKKAAILCSESGAAIVYLFEGTMGRSPIRLIFDVCSYGWFFMKARVV
jgi:hypothetical protein